MALQSDAITRGKAIKLTGAALAASALGIFASEDEAEARGGLRRCPRHRRPELRSGHRRRPEDAGLVLEGRRLGRLQRASAQRGGSDLCPRRVRQQAADLPLLPPRDSVARREDGPTCRGGITVVVGATKPSF